MLKVIQWATGAVGRHAVMAVHSHPELELVGAYTYSEAKAGRDIGEICGIERIGVTATSDVEKILALEADCVLYMAIGEINPHGALDDICMLLESGKNVVSTAVTALIYPEAMGRKVVERLEAACLKGGTSFHATGIEPGWAAEVLPLTMSGVLHRIDSLVVQEILDYSTYNNPDVLFDIMGFGKRPDEPVVMEEADALKPTFAAPLMLVAKGLAARIDDFKYHREIAVTHQDIQVSAGVVRAGTVAAQRFGYTAIVGGRPALTVEHITRLRSDLAPQWPSGRGWTVRIKGLPSMVLESRIGVDGEDEVDQGTLATAMHAVHAVVPVCAAASGIRTFLDLPIITGRCILGGRPLADGEAVYAEMSTSDEAPATVPVTSAAFEKVVATMRQRVATLDAFGKRLNFVLDDHVMHIDGTTAPPVVTTVEATADARISVSVENFSKLLDKRLKPMFAFMSGKVRIKGEMSAASALQKIF